MALRKYERVGYAGAQPRGWSGNRDPFWHGVGFAPSKRWVACLSTPSTTAEWSPHLSPAWSPERHVHSITAHRLFNLVALLSLLVCCVAKCRSTTFKLYHVQHYTCLKQNGWIDWIEAGLLGWTSGASQPHQPAARSPQPARNFAHLSHERYIGRRLNAI